jgi:hypothetical protein
LVWVGPVTRRPPGAPPGAPSHAPHAAERGEERVRVVLGERAVGVEAGGAGARRGGGRGPRAGGVGGAVDAVGAAGEEDDRAGGRAAGSRASGGRAPLEGERRGEGALLVAAAAAGAAHRDGGLAAPEQAGGAPARRGGGEGRVGGGRAGRARLARRGRVDHARVVAERRGLAAGGGERVGVAAGEHAARPGERRVAGLERLGRRAAQPGAEVGAHGVRHPPPEPAGAQHGGGVGERGRVGRGGAAGDDRRVVAGHVGEHERQHVGGGGRGGEPPAADARQVAAHRVDGGDVGAAAQQQAERGPRVAEGDAAGERRPERGAAARHQQEDEVAGAGVGAQRERLGGGRRAGRVGLGVAGLAHADPRRPRRRAGEGGRVAVRHRDRAAEGRAGRQARGEQALGGAGHRHRRLAGAGDDDAAVRA